MTVTICLASQSPRRLALMQTLGIECDVRIADIDESVRTNELPADYVQRLAVAKAETVAARLAPDTLVLAADTCVSLDDDIFGKPRDEDDAVRMLSKLSGREHDVYTGVCLRDGVRAQSVVSHSRVTFKTLTESTMRRYWQTGEPRDKAGAYAIQGIGATMVTHLQGSYSGVVGLPLSEVADLMTGFGVAIL